MAADMKGPNAPNAVGVLGLGLFGLLLFSYPWLSSTLQGRYALGMPVSLLYLMAVWLLLTGLVAVSRGDD